MKPIYQFTIVSFVLFMSACSSVTVSPITGPDGTENELITCQYMGTGDCYQKAREICGGNYKIVNSDAFSQTKYQEGAFEILVKCDSLAAVQAARSPKVTNNASSTNTDAGPNNDYPSAHKYSDCDQYLELAKDTCREVVFNRSNAPAKPKPTATPAN